MLRTCSSESQPPVGPSPASPPGTSSLTPGVEAAPAAPLLAHRFHMKYQTDGYKNGQGVHTIVLQLLHVSCYGKGELRHRWNGAC